MNIVAGCAGLFKEKLRVQGAAEPTAGERIRGQAFESFWDAFVVVPGDAVIGRAVERLHTSECFTVVHLRFHVPEEIFHEGFVVVVAFPGH